MARSRFWGLTVLSLALAVTIIPIGWSDSQKIATSTSKSSCTKDKEQVKSGDEETLTYTIYGLSDLGSDPNFGQWIAETIPRVIEPESWNRIGVCFTEKPKLVAEKHVSYFAPRRILVVYHTPAVQTQVDAFLKKMKKALPHEKERATAKSKDSATHDRLVVPAKYSAPAPIEDSEPPMPPKTSYPVPNPSKSPKHLFHFIIRYEGDGIIDDNVRRLLKDIYGDKKAKEEKAEKEPSAPKTPEGVTLPESSYAPSAPMSLPMPPKADKAAKDPPPPVAKPVKEKADKGSPKPLPKPSKAYKDT